MRRMVSLMLSALLLFAVTFAAVPQPAKASEPADWTFLVYLDGDNNLDPYGVADINEMELVGSSDRVNIIVLYDRSAEGATLYRITKGGTDAIDSAPLEYWGEVNMGDPATLARFVDHASELFPAEHVALDLWDHGGGWYGICWDDSSVDEEGKSDCLTLDEVQSVLAGRDLALLGTDACLMAMAETVCEWQDCAEVLVLAEDVIPGNGWPYDAILGALVANPDMTPAALGAQTVSDYLAEYGENSSVTLSAIDTAGVPAIVSAADNLAHAMLANPEHHGAVAGAQGVAESYGSMGQNYPFVDLIGFCESLAEKSFYPTTQVAALELKAAVEASIIAEAHGQVAYGAHGLTIYLPLSEPNYREVYGTGLDFPELTDWDEFLAAFYHSWQ